MGTKLIENIVLVVGLLIVGAAVFLMFFDEKGQVAQSVNIIFSVGFIVYIIYSHMLSRNLNREISDLNVNISNLKEEVVRLESTVKKRDEKIKGLKADLKSLEAKLDDAQNTISDKEKELAAAQKRIAELETDNQQNEAS